MSSRRVLKAAESIRQVVSMAILVELKDPRIENVTVTFVEVSADMRNAKIHVSVMADETKQRLCLKGLQNSAGYLQQKINDRIDTRYVPKIRFVLDQGVKNSIAVTKILDEVLPAESADANDSSSEQAAEENVTDAPTDFASDSESDSAAAAAGDAPSEAGSAADRADSSEPMTPQSSPNPDPDNRDPS